MARCYYCHKENAEGVVKISSGSASSAKVEVPYCSEDCKEQLIKFSDYAEKNVTKFLLLLFIPLMTMILGNGIIAAMNYNASYADYITSAAVLIISLTIIKFPFATPQTNDWLGVKRAVLGVRIMGGALMIFEIVYLFTKVI